MTEKPPILPPSPAAPKGEITAPRLPMFTPRQPGMNQPRPSIVVPPANAAPSPPPTIIQFADAAPANPHHGLPQSITSGTSRKL